MNPAALELQQVTIELGARTLIAGLSLIVEPGQVVTLMGESGVGKSSLLAWMCGTMPEAFRASGRVLHGATDLSLLPPEDRRLGILFQDDLLFPHLSVGQNLAFALPAALRSRAERRTKVERALDEAGLSGYADRDPATLSGGQRARVAVMRVLLSEPRALLLDEPFSKLDHATRQRFRQFVFDHLREARLPTLLVTHDPEDALAAAGMTLELPSVGSPQVH